MTEQFQTEPDVFIGTPPWIMRISGEGKIEVAVANSKAMCRIDPYAKGES